MEQDQGRSVKGEKPVQAEIRSQPPIPHNNHYL
jgi:hypothetical protein